MNDFNAKLIADLRAHGGQATSGPFVGRPVLIVTVRGARSGQPREIPLAYSERDGSYVIVASKGGAPNHPAWYHNLKANPDVTVEVLGRTFHARAREAAGQEYEDLYRHHAEGMPTFWDYRRKTEGVRQIPVIVLEPAAQPAAGQR